MSENKHTPEPWYASEEGGNWRAMAADENGGYTLADMCCDDQEANARRITACVNACEGIPTYQLTGEDEDPVILGDMIDLLRNQRDELLAFAEEVRRSGDTRLASMAIATIASVKGEQ